MASGEQDSSRRMLARVKADPRKPLGPAGETAAFSTGAWPLQERPRYSLALKFALPVVLIILIVMGLMAISAQRWLYDSLVNEVKKNGATAVGLLAQFGRQILMEKAKFDADPKFAEFVHLPEDSDEKVLPANRHWLVTGGYISAERWAELAGAATPYALISPLKARHAQRNAELLAPLLRYNRGGARNEILTAYIRTPAPENALVMATFPLVAPVEIVSEDWIGDNGASLGTIRIDGPAFRFEQVQVWAGRLKESGQPEREALMFMTPVYRSGDGEGDGELLGNAIMGLRADVILKEQRDLSRLVWGFAVGMLMMSVFAMFLIARLATRPLRFLVHDMAVVSNGRFDHQTRAASHDEIGIAARAFNLMTKRLAAAQVREREATRLENELATASAIQKNLLPARLPQVPGYDISAFYRPAREVGGDYYDFLNIDTDHLGMVVADVSGKSIPGALVMSTTRTILRFVAPGNPDAADVLRRTNAIVAGDIKRGMFVTAYYLILDTRARKMLLASAGHNPLVLARADGTLETYNPGGIALGFDKGPVFERTIRSCEVELAPGDRVVIYTDGVVEAKNARDEEYGDEQFRAFVRENRALSSEAFVAALVADVDRFVDGAEASDDITVVTFCVD